MLLLLAHFLTPSSDPAVYQEAVSTILSQLTGSSLKYSVVILRSLVHKLLDNKFAKFIILSHLYLFTPLLFDATLQDVLTLLQEFREISQQVVREELDGENKRGEVFKAMTVSTFRRALGLVLSGEYQVQKKRVSMALEFLATVLKALETQTDYPSCDI
jgi:hypothetical protein